MFRTLTPLTEMEREVLHAAQDLIRQGIEPTSGRIKTQCPDIHGPTLVTTRNRLRRRGLIRTVPVLRIYEEPATLPATETKIVGLPKKPALDRICHMPDGDHKMACRTVLKIWRESF